MLRTSNEIRNPGLRALPPGVERYFVKGGGLSVIEVFPEDKIEIINDEGKGRMLEGPQTWHGDLIIKESLICQF
ncbi:hypothetical protein OAP12_00140 [Candidatus Pelagibacter sp.]|nr:hypothetical protein [Candidatus Pelagibacter sp.]